MWTRRELKDRAKPAFRNNYWKCVLVALVLMILVDGATFTFKTNGSRNVVNSGLDLSPDVLLEDDTEIDFYEDDADIDFYEENTDTAGNILEDVSPVTALIATLSIGFFIVFLLIALAVQIFVCNPIEVGGCSFFLRNTKEKPGPGELFYAFQSGNYGKIVMTLFLRNLYTVLWTFLLIVPGIVKSYEYRMIPYLLADNPDMSREEAFRLSKEMMDGQKWNAFVLDLSFIGWDILSTFTWGLVGIFWTNPYRYATNAELYLTLKSPEIRF